jgi:hypothetical protein
MGSALMDAGVPTNPVRVAGHAEGIVDLGVRERRPEIMDDRDEIPSAERSGLVIRLPEGPANRSLS